MCTVQAQRVHDRATMQKALSKLLWAHTMSQSQARVNLMKHKDVKTASEENTASCQTKRDSGLTMRQRWGYNRRKRKANKGPPKPKKKELVFDAPESELNAVCAMLLKRAENMRERGGNHRLEMKQEQHLILND